MVKKIGFVASSGGHFEQIMMLKPLMKKYNGFIVTEKTEYSVAIENTKIYYVKQVNRKDFLLILKMINNLIKSYKIFRYEKPDVIISTGALATIPICIVAKFLKKKVIFIESFAKVNSPTLTGKLMYKIADRFYIQWEEMRRFYPNATYLGGIY